MKKQFVVVVVLAVLLGAVVYKDGFRGRSNGATASRHAVAGMHVLPMQKRTNSPGAASSGGRPKTGKALPAFTLTTLSGKTVSLPNSSGKPYIIDFFNSWCQPCNEEAPELQKIYKKYGQKLQVYAVNITMDDKIADVKSFVEKYQLTFPVLLDKNENNSVTDNFGIMSIPTSYFVSADGVVQQIHPGYKNAETLLNQVAQLLGE